MSSNKLSIIIPAYNEEETIKSTFNRLIQLNHLVQEKLELIFINDGSSDNTLSKLLELINNVNKTEAEVKVVEFSRNFGHSSAVLAGLTEASGDYIAIIDADLQDPPEHIPKMLTKLTQDNLDVVYGQRKKRRGETLVKRFTAWLFYRILNILSGADFPKDTGDFRVITKRVKDSVLSCHEKDPFMRGLVSWVGFKQSPYFYDRDSRRFGETKYTFKKMMRFASLAIISFSSKPLYIAGFIGVLGLILSLFMASWAFISWIIGGTVRGWSSLLIVVSFFQSFLLIIIGIQGVYIGRIYKEVMGRPRFIVRNTYQNI